MHGESIKISGKIGIRNEIMNLIKKPKLFAYWLITFGLVFFLLLVFVYISKNRNWPTGFSFVNSLLKNQKETFAEEFGKKIRKIEEAGKKSESSDKNWWVNSGGWMEISRGTGKTIEGNLSSSDKWFTRYKKNNPEDTDNGLHPQNIFRLVTRRKWQNFRQQVFFKIKNVNLSASDNRNESNGVLLFNRYQDGDDLYYAGLRVDGYAVIKKKISGDYHTLSSKRVFSGGYDHDSNPNLLPVGKWMGIRTVVQTKKNGDVEISLFWKKKRSSKKWKLAVRCTDKGQKGNKITDPGYGGIRTDFMDVEFDKYRISEL